MAPDALYTTDRLTLGAIDLDLDPGTYSYRTMAFDGEDKALAASPVRTVNVKPVKALGALDAVVEGGILTVGWTPFAGPEACFSTYKLVASTTDETPSYLDGAEALWAGESQGTSEAVIEGLAPGTLLPPPGGPPDDRGRQDPRRPDRHRDDRGPVGGPATPR